MRAGAALGLCVAAVMSAAPALADPSSDYMLHCRGCHGADGDGAAGAVPSFRGQLGRFVAVPGGREYLVRVPGTSQSELDDAHIATLLNWMLHEFSPEQIPPGFAPYTREEVARVRRPPLVDVETVRAGLVHSIDGR